MQKTTTDLFEQLARQLGHLDERQIDRLRAEADVDGLAFDEHCLRSGALDAETVAALRQDAEKIERKRSLAGKYQLGGIAVELGFLDEHRLTRALRRQRKLRQKQKIDARLGELFLVRGDLSIEELETVLKEQSQRLGRCTSCDEVFRLVTFGRRARCPKCDARLSRPETDERHETLRRAKTLKTKMLDRFDRKQMVLDASDAVAKLQREAEKKKETDEAPETSGPVAQLTVIDLDSDEMSVTPSSRRRTSKKTSRRSRRVEAAEERGDAIGSARIAFTDFYEQLSEDLAEVGEECTRPSGRTLNEALAQAKAVKAKQVAETKHFPIFAVTTLTLVVCAAVFAGWLYWKSENDRVAHREKFVAERQAPTVAVDPIAALTPGKRVRITGVIRGGEGNLNTDRTAMSIVARGFGTFWAEDPNRTLKDLFATLKERHGQQMRTAVVLEGELVATTQLDRSGLPADAAPRLWIRYDPATLRVVRYDEMCAEKQALRTLDGP